MNPRELFARRTTAQALAPLLSSVLPLDMLEDLASVPQEEELATLPAAMRAAHALRDLQETPAVLYAIEHALKPELEEIRNYPLSGLEADYNLYELLERRRPARTILALQLDGRDPVQDLGVRLLSELAAMRQRMDARLRPAAPRLAGGAIASELRSITEDSAEVMHRLAEIETVMLDTLPHEDTEPELPEPLSEEAIPDWRRFLLRKDSEEDEAVAEMLEAVEDELPEPEAEDAAETEQGEMPAPEIEAEETEEVHDVADIPSEGTEVEEPPVPVESPAPPKTQTVVLRGRTVLLLGGSARCAADYERMLRELGARPRHAPEPDLLEESAPRQLLDEADLVVALGDTLLDATAERILERASAAEIPHFRYHSTAVEGVRHFLLSLAEKGLL